MGIDYIQKVTTFEDFIVPLMPHGCHLSGSINLLQLLFHLNNAYSHSSASTYSPFGMPPHYCLPSTTHHIYSKPLHTTCNNTFSSTSRYFQVPSLSLLYHTNYRLMWQLIDCYSKGYHLGYTFLLFVLREMQKYYGKRQQHLCIFLN